LTLSWENLEKAIKSCQGCALYAGCTQKVPGQGNRKAPLMLIGEGPGEVEDREGLAFVGPAGQLLTRMLKAIGLEREQVFICNIVKCRPPHNRQPLPEEAEACKGFLRAQTALVRPRVILLLGATAARNTLGDEIRITRDRGKWFERKGVWMMPTYHPSALLRDPGKKREAWEDLKRVRAKLTELDRYREALDGRENGGV